MAWREHSATVRGVRVPYLDSGDPQSRDVALFVHAFPVGMRMWESVAVPAGWRALAPALPGFDGASLADPTSTSIDDYARATLAFIDHLDVNNAVVGGVSMGGYVTFALWRLAPRRWRGLLLADTRAGADSEQARAGRQQLMEVVKTNGTRGVADDMIPKLLGETTRNRRPAVVEEVRRLVERQSGEGIAAAIVRLRDRPDSTALLDEIDVPALVIVGEEDKVTPPSEAEQMQARLAKAQLVRIPDAGHLSCIEHPAAFNAALAAFLTGFAG